MALLGEVFFNVGINPQRFESGMNNMQKSSQAFENTLKKLGSTIATVFSAVAIEEFVRRSIDSFVEFDKAITNVATMSSANMDMMKSSVKEMAMEFGKSVNQTADALYYIVSAGYDGEAGLEVLRATMMGATAGAADLKTTADALTSTMEVFGLTTEDLNKILDLQFTALKLGKFEYQDLASAIGIFLPSARALGSTLEEAMGTFAYLTKTLAPDEAKTSLNAIYRSLSQNVDVMQELGIQMYDSQGKFVGLATVAEQVAQKMQGMSDAEKNALIQALELDARAARGFLQLTQNVDNYKQTLEAMTQSTGAASEAFSKQEQSMAMLLDKLKVAKDVAFKSFGELMVKVLGPAIEKLTSGLQKLANWLSDVAQRIEKPTDLFKVLAEEAGKLWDKMSLLQKTLVSLGMAFAGLKTITLVQNLVVGLAGQFTALATSATTSFKTIATGVQFLAANPQWLALSAAIAGVVAVIKLIYDNWDSIVNLFNTTVKTIGDWFTGLFEALGIGWDTTLGVIKDFLDFISENFASVIETIRNLWDGLVDGIKALWEGFKQFWIDLWETLKSTFFGWVDKISNAFKKVKDFFKGIGSGIKGLFDWGGEAPAAEYQHGGFTANVGKNRIAGVVHGGEWVAPAWMVEKYGYLIALLENIRQRGYQEGGTVGIPPINLNVANNVSVEGPKTHSVVGETFTVGSTQNIVNNFNFTFKENMILTEDDRGTRRLAELIVKSLREQGIEVIS